MKKILSSGLILGLLLTGAAQAAVINVPGDFAQIHDAVQAAVEGDIVQVAAGTYHDCTHPTEGPESTPACVIMKSGVTLRGAGIGQTIIDAQALGRGIFIENVENCSVENLTITHCHADIFGAGILVRQVGNSVEVVDVRVTGCTDGGVICINAGSPTLRRVTMDNNVAKQGGGLAIEEQSSPLVLDCVVENNESPSGAGIFVRNGCEPVLDGCTVANNTITSNWGNGGGVSFQNSTPTITNCIFENNTTLGYGGGVAFLDATSGLMEDCIVRGNDAAYDYSVGGGIAVQTSDPIIRRVLVEGNTASGFYAETGGIDVSFNASAPLGLCVIENCTVVGNSTGPNGSSGGISAQWGATPVVDKCIISGSTSGVGLFCSNPGPSVSCTNIFGNAGGDDLCGVDEGGNFSADPMFCGTPGFEYALESGSPCAPGNHPNGQCEEALIGAIAGGCSGSSPVLPGVGDLVLGNHPNPFNPRTTIYFDMPSAGSAQLRIYDLGGRLIAEKTWDHAPQGRTEFPWNGLDRDGRALSSGIYLYRLDTGDHSLSRRMSLIR